MTRGESTLPIIENVTAPEVYTEGLCKVTVIGSRIRLTYYVVREIDGQLVRWPVLEMVCPRSALSEESIEQRVALVNAAIQRSIEEGREVGTAIH